MQTLASKCNTVIASERQQTAYTSFRLYRDYVQTFTHVEQVKANSYGTSLYTEDLLRWISFSFKGIVPEQ